MHVNDALQKMIFLNLVAITFLNAAIVSKNLTKISQNL